MNQDPPAPQLGSNRAARRWVYPFEYPLIVYAVAVIACSWIYSFEVNWRIVLAMRLELLLILIGLPWWLALLYTWHRTSGGMSKSAFVRLFKQEALSIVASPGRLLEVPRTLIGMKLCISLYSHLKQQIPAINPRLFDALFDRADRVVHLGFSPVELALITFGSPWSARAIDLLYIVWYIVKAPVMLFFLFHPDPRRRWHFFTSYVLLWMIGGTIAILMPSVGPIYVQPELFADLQAPMAQKFQAMLWEHYQQFLAAPEAYRTIQYEGVAAFPSLHVGVIAIFTFALQPYRWIFRAMVAFTAAIQIGSVLLGWHYAVDGYFAIALAAAIYYGTRPLFRPRPGSQTPPAHATAIL